MKEAIATLATLLAACALDLDTTDTEVTSVTFTPTPIASDVEVVNAMRGLYKWNGKEVAPQPAPSPDAYGRYFWRDLEVAKDVYDFSAIENEIKAAAAEGRKYSLRVRAMRDYEDGQLYVPAYLGSHGWWADTDDDGQRETFVPDWNNWYVLARAKKLIARLGATYNADPRVAWIDIGIYGQFGEWYLNPSVDYSTAPAGIAPATLASLNAIVDMHVANFASKHLVAFLRRGAAFDAMLHAWSQTTTTYPVGWRADCLGRAGYFDQFMNDTKLWPQVANRWKVAPVITELCYVTPGSGAFAVALQQVKDLHVSLVSNGNTASWDSFNWTEQQQFLATGRAAGYRFTLDSVALPQVIAQGASFTAIARWSNRGVAPAYEPWKIRFQLRKPGTSTVAWQGTSTLDLTALRPILGSSHQDTFTLPSTIATGTYDVVVRVDDPRHTRAPLALAIVGRASDGSYKLGQISVTSGADTTKPIVTITNPVADVPRGTSIVVQATATDDVGVEYVELLVGSTLLCRDATISATGKYGCSWAVPSQAGVTYTLTARAYDAAGNTASQSLNVTAR